MILSPLELLQETKRAMALAPMPSQTISAPHDYVTMGASELMCLNPYCKLLPKADMPSAWVE